MHFAKACDKQFMVVWRMCVVSDVCIAFAIHVRVILYKVSPEVALELSLCFGRKGPLPPMGARTPTICASVSSTNVAIAFSNRLLSGHFAKCIGADLWVPFFAYTLWVAASHAENVSSMRVRHSTSFLFQIFCITYCNLVSNICSFYRPDDSNYCQVECNGAETNTRLVSHGDTG